MENLYRRNPSGSTRRNFLKGAGALGLTLAATGGARGQSASVVVINEDGSVSTTATLAANPNAAHWVSPSAFVASSLETGRMAILSHGAAMNLVTPIPMLSRVRQPA
jgi:hypothetical protein